MQRVVLFANDRIMKTKRLEDRIISLKGYDTQIVPTRGPNCLWDTDGSEIYGNSRIYHAIERLSKSRVAI